MEAAVSEPKTPDGAEPQTSTTRRAVVEAAGAGVIATSMMAASGCATAAAQGNGSLYERLGGVFPIAAVVDHFSDALIRNPVVGQQSQNAQLRAWHTNNLTRLPGLKFMRTLWVCNVSGGPFQYTPTRPGRTDVGLEVAHRDLRISPAEFDEVAAELGRTLDHFEIPVRDKTEVLAAFAAHKDEVTEGYRNR
jgi:hemoglobin